ncbi:hypothetical protein BHM03_00058049 [Ensete ventricosum]|uniref:Uncharacterized protein n=1 Tax=Ensete ventricosum TaxID=4639 RepID=A0A445MMI4_ENSVE|nr:hypothetical protein BHM03_00058049 [Ensete ventricosum]
MDGCDILFSFCLRVRFRLAHTSGWGLLTHRNLFWRERKRKSCAGSHVSSEYWGPKRLFVWIWLSLCLARARVLLTFAHPRSDSQAFYTECLARARVLLTFAHPRSDSQALYTKCIVRESAEAQPRCSP